jgi:hypothetical protein
VNLAVGWRQSGTAARGWVVGVAVLALLVGGAYAGDQYARGQTEQEVATQVATVFDGLDHPAVTIHGFPFVTQLIGGKFGHVTGTTDRVVFDGVTAADVKVEAHDVTMSPTRAGSATVSATISAQTAEDLLRTRTGLDDLGVRVEGDRLVVTTDLYGHQLAVSGTLTASPGAVHVSLGTASLGGVSTDLSGLPSGLRHRLDDLAIPVTGLPAGFHLTGAQVVPDGLRFTATATDVRLTR